MERNFGLLVCYKIETDMLNHIDLYYHTLPWMTLHWLKDKQQKVEILLYDVTGKSLSEALILKSTNPQYDDILFIKLRVQYMKIAKICVHNMY